MIEIETPVDTLKYSYPFCFESKIFESFPCYNLVKQQIPNNSEIIH